MRQSEPEPARLLAVVPLIPLVLVLAACQSGTSDSGSDGRLASAFSGADDGRREAMAEGRRARALESALEGRLDRTSDAGLDAVYGDGPTPLWTDGNGLAPSGRTALNELRTVTSEGLDPRRYGSSRLADLAAQAEAPEELARLDVELTRALRLLSQDLARGVVASTGFDPEWRLDSVDTARLPRPARSGDGLLRHLDSVRPSVRQYARLQEALGKLRGIRDSGGWVEVPEDVGTLEEGDSSAVVARLRDRLMQSLGPEERALAEEGAARPAFFDPALAQSVSFFQQRHDVNADGVVGPETLEALNAPVIDRIARVELALERWRWLPATLGSAAVLVNTPGRRVHVLEDGIPVLTMKAIIGERDWKTALFQDEMERLVINPYWNVPEDIMKEETLPKAKEDATYLSRNGFQVLEPETGDTVALSSVDWEDVDADTFPYRIRQKPGEDNALGSVKFLFPNRHAIYLHDTPAVERFDERLRTLSHGCVRVEHPQELARYLLREASDHDPARFGALRQSGERHVLELDEHVPTYVVYQTVWVRDTGAPVFTPDVYGRDTTAMRALSSETEIFEETP